MSSVITPINKVRRKRASSCSAGSGTAATNLSRLLTEELQGFKSYQGSEISEHELSGIDSLDSMDPLNTNTSGPDSVGMWSIDALFGKDNQTEIDQLFKEMDVSKTYSKPHTINDCVDSTDDKKKPPLDEEAEKERRLKHTVKEKERRFIMKDKIIALGEVLPKGRGLNKLNTILSACEYIKILNKEINDMKMQNDLIRKQLNSSFAHNRQSLYPNNPMQAPHNTSRFTNFPMDSSGVGKLPISALPPQRGRSMNSNSNHFGGVKRVASLNRAPYIQPYFPNPQPHFRNTSSPYAAYPQRLPISPNHLGSTQFGYNNGGISSNSQSVENEKMFTSMKINKLGF